MAFFLLTAGIHYAFAHNTPGIDFYVYWQAGRAFFFEGLDPYSPAVSARIQQGIYGREALPGEDPMHFANPAYGLLPVLPWLLLPFDWAQAAWMAINLLALLALLLAAFPRAPRWVLLLAPFFYPMVFGLILGNFAVLVFGIMAAAFGFFFREPPPGRGLSATFGVLLAWATIKPQSVWLFLVIFLLAAWRRRNRALLGGFAAGLGGMVAISLLVRPDWPLRWVERVLRYSGYSNYQPSRVFWLNLLLPETMILPASIALAIVLLGLCGYLLIRWQRGRLPLLVLLGWSGLAMYFIHPNSLSYEQLILLLPLLLWVLEKDRKPRCLLLFWLGGWVFSYAVLAASWHFGVRWPVLHLPLAGYLFWLVWLSAICKRSNLKIIC